MDEEATAVLEEVVLDKEKGETKQQRLRSQGASHAVSGTPDTPLVLWP